MRRETFWFRPIAALVASLMLVAGTAGADEGSGPAIVLARISAGPSGVGACRS